MVKTAVLVPLSPSTTETSSMERAGCVAVGVFVGIAVFVTVVVGMLVGVVVAVFVGVDVAVLVGVAVFVDVGGGVLDGVVVLVGVLVGVGVDVGVLGGVAVFVGVGVGVALAIAPNSNAPISQVAIVSLLPSTGRSKPRWSVLAQVLSSPASMAGLPLLRAGLSVLPSLSAKAASSGSPLRLPDVLPLTVQSVLS